MKILSKKMIVSALALTIAPFSMLAQTMEINLQKAIEIALAENPTMRVADKDIQLKEIANDEAWQALLPTADVTMQAQHAVQVGRINLGGQTLPMGTDKTTSATAALTVALPLYAPTTYLNMKISKHDIEVARETARSSKIELVNQVTKAYYGALLSKDSYGVMQRSYNVAKENYELVEKKFNVGKVSEYDKISAEVQMRSMNSTMISSKTGYDLALLKLKVLMGVKTDLDIIINDSLKAYESQLTLANTEASVAEIDNNSQMRQLELSSKQIDLGLKSIKSLFLPSANLAWSGQYQSMANKDFMFNKYTYYPSSSITLSINVPIFHYTNFTKLKTAKLEKLKLGDKRESSRQQLEMEMNSYRQNMIATLSKLESDRQAVTQADKAVSISSKRYDVGRGTILELNQSETALAQAELTYCQGIYDFLANKADLDKTLGRE